MTSLLSATNMYIYLYFAYSSRQPYKKYEHRQSFVTGNSFPMNAGEATVCEANLKLVILVASYKNCSFEY